ncbi:tRNA (adenosine(37)-N6)-threonylcarbamoyltransferase complex dimerization subunit type 1 TsaB [Aquabacterium sp.]|uniref:tRNA (adenosine(37)-N6)-threonylcarbamoyltransferase complex dimerization subunit type 1 TsaB n=1 Tax=Aquabacterium sp. TaxID=1872578 RepID=UPI0019A07E01|nr:tRNA (adenosine(37)-N6)-threonylcarbamoyltransferase complex dimerization subunit type 1 TsaB [Aquabacterium sp.]MBC7699047.1 tRNA (adenosine(37)-N6)-threonylcarbamoyltransferase complex dimerization subunit type 1 TsaB [Aquabacterium sp.]
MSLADSISSLPTAASAALAKPRLLVLDTATELVHLALVLGDEVQALHVGGGAQASSTTLPALQKLLADAGLSWSQLDAIAFGRGPGAFTGLRTACSLAQGLALAAGCPVISLDTLMAVAEDARQSDPAAWSEGDTLWVAQDARMGELYVAAYRWQGAHWQAQTDPSLWALGVPRDRWAETPGVHRVAGNALLAHPAAFDGLTQMTWPQAAPRGAALAALARQAWARDELLDAALALPMYVRDKVAQTTAERLAAKRL